MLARAQIQHGRDDPRLQIEHVSGDPQLQIQHGDRDPGEEGGDPGEDAGEGGFTVHQGEGGDAHEDRAAGPQRHQRTPTIPRTGRLLS